VLFFLADLLSIAGIPDRTAVPIGFVTGSKPCCCPNLFTFFLKLTKLVSLAFPFRFEFMH
jgi:hypothetical protein